LKPFYVYMLRCADESFYVGHTDELERRLAEHGDGLIPGYTSTRRPVELVWSAEMTTRDEALVVERQLKGWTRAKKEALVRGDWTGLNRLARGKDWTERSGAVRPSTTRPARGSAKTGTGATLGTNGGDETRPARGSAETGTGATLRTNGGGETNETDPFVLSVVPRSAASAGRSRSTKEDGSPHA
jgi:predicted GIY-YIG superfamily endonuclease